MDIDNLPAGRELDALIAEKVFGSPKPTVAFDNVHICSPDGVWAWIATKADGSDFDWRPLLPYSRDIAAAWEVVEKMRNYCFTIGNLPSGYWNASFHGTVDVVGSDTAETAPLAICRAALKAVTR